MDETMKLILESLQLLLVQEREQNVAELMLHRNQLTRQNHTRVIEEVDVKLATIDEILNPPEAEDEGDCEEGDQGEPEANQGQGEDTE